jgi:ketosteroid isomerase-like protein
MTETEERFKTPQEAEAAFYAAFEAGDLAAMMAVWADSDAVECIHPLGGRLTGRKAVEEGWRQVLGGARRLKVQRKGVRYAHTRSVALHTLTEHIRVEGGSQTTAPIIATNVYHHTPQGWRMILHHASPSPEGARHKSREPEHKVTLH